MTTGANEPKLIALGELRETLRADAAEAYAAAQEGRKRGPVTGMPKLDQQLGGMLAPGLHIVHAGPGLGKTAFCLQVAATCGFPALFISCEMACLELIRRIIARVTSTSLDFIRAGQFSPDVMTGKFDQAVSECPNLTLLDATEAYASAEFIRTAAVKVRGNVGKVLVVVDSVHSWADAVPVDAEEYAALNAAVAALRTLARTLDCPILAVAERNRASMKSGGISASAGSRKFEYGAESVIELDRAEDTPRNGAGEVPVTLRLAKNRNGAKGLPVNLLWLDTYQRFREVPSS